MLDLLFSQGQQYLPGLVAAHLWGRTAPLRLASRRLASSRDRAFRILPTGRDDFLPAKAGGLLLAALQRRVIQIYPGDIT